MTSSVHPHPFSGPIVGQAEGRTEGRSLQVLKRKEYKSLNNLIATTQLQKIPDGVSPSPCSGCIDVRWLFWLPSRSKEKGYN